MKKLDFLINRLIRLSQSNKFLNMVNHNQEADQVQVSKVVKVRFNKIFIPLKKRSGSFVSFSKFLKSI